ncbi:hypothetical protein COV61_03635 [Candidatus Micrarchaeota archaeon CG11_big_fil_rev_8_21_14_0_20_47_5]|nr:MAG: hypothetical protein AUJ17_00690 [Candidatus Micrarchaeota archaeon CG1_02_47_40]PIN83262.1 MAG: hypothetical protein COV61_03635 [Candidatus Micrarchaeota archaeon CG11_big_fil_rev_8_21_14_0_20_47_5]
MQKISPEIEEYLESVYRRKEKGETAKTKEIARVLGVSAPSVSQMFAKLARAGFIEYKPYGGAVLTMKGEKIGKSITRKHRLIEKFLAFIGVKRKIHDEACVLEHAVSDDVERAMERLVREKSAKSIMDMKRGECGRVALISAGRAAKRRLVEMGLTDGTRIRIERQPSLIGPIEISVRGSMLAIGRGLAAKVFVKPCV